MFTQYIYIYPLYRKTKHASIMTHNTQCGENYTGFLLCLDTILLTNSIWYLIRWKKGKKTETHFYLFFFQITCGIKLGMSVITAQWWQELLFIFVRITLHNSICCYTKLGGCDLIFCKRIIWTCWEDNDSVTNTT